MAAPARCITAITFCEAKKRSTSIPSTNGERIDAIGPAEKASPISSDMLCWVITRPSVTDQLPQIKNCRNIISDSRGTSSRCCAIAFPLLSVVDTMMSLTQKK